MSGDFAFFSPRRIRETLESHAAAVRRRWGQNFLVDPNQARRIAELVLDHTRRPLLEIGPGLGAITHLLLESGRPLRAVEIDPVLCAVLRRTYGERLDLHEGDAREILAAEVQERDCCGNLPYYLSTELLLGAVQAGVERAVFLLQKEFVERAAATDAAGSLPVFLSCFGKVSSLAIVRRAAFFPKPNVDSAVLAFVGHADGPSCPPDILEEILRASFQMRRKMLRASWKHSPVGSQLFAVAEALDCAVDRRPEELSKEEFFGLANALARLRSPQTGP